MRKPATAAALLALALAAFAAACGGPSNRDVVAGGLYWAPADAGDFFVFNLLVVDDEGVHLRIYSNSFAEPPAEVDEAALYLDEGGPTPGTAHTAVSWRWFETWETGLVQQSSVADEELDGYRRWLISQSPAFATN
jgi:hypothetical protein